jgi:hypothetical protein
MTSLSNEDIQFVYALYTLYSQRAGSFQWKEFPSIFNIMTKLENYLIELKTHEGKPDINEIQLELTTEDLRFILSTITVTSERIITPFKDQKPLNVLYEKIETIINENSADTSTKAIENSNIATTVEEVQ